MVLLWTGYEMAPTASRDSGSDCVLDLYVDEAAATTPAQVTYNYCTCVHDQHLFYTIICLKIKVHLYLSCFPPYGGPLVRCLSYSSRDYDTFAGSSKHIFI